MSSANIEPDRAWFDREIERLQSEDTVLETQLARLEQRYARTPALLQILSSYFGFGAAGNLGWARFKLKLKQEELLLFKSQYEALKVSAPRAGSKLESQPELSPEAMGKLLSIIRSK